MWRSRRDGLESTGWKVVDEAELMIREMTIWLSGLIMHSHLLLGENWTSRAPEEKDDGVVILETLRPSPSSGFLRRRWKIFISDVVATARRVPSELKLAELMFASPLTRIFATSFFPLTSVSSSFSWVGSGDLLKRQI